MKQAITSPGIVGAVATPQHTGPEETVFLASLRLAIPRQEGWEFFNCENVGTTKSLHYLCSSMEEEFDIKEELNKLGIKNGDVIKADQE